jgi:hypothetical protein
MNVHHDIDNDFCPPEKNLGVFLENGRTTMFLPHRSEGARNNGICFFKPELCHAGLKICFTALNALYRRSRAAGISVTGLYGFSGVELVTNGVLDRIYSDIARNAALSFCASTTPDKFATIADTAFGRAVPVRGGLAMARSGVPPATLLKAWQAAPEVHRVEPECYAAPITFKGQKILLINGFYPYQVAQYEAKDARILLAFLETERDFSWLKTRFQGDADPDRRVPGSFRGFLSEEMTRSGHPALTTSLNGMHMSGSVSDGQHEASIFSAYIIECGL